MFRILVEKTKKRGKWADGEKNAFRILVQKTKERGKWADGKSIRMDHKELGWAWTGFTWFSIGPCVRDGLLVSKKELCFMELAGETLRLQAVGYI